MPLRGDTDFLLSSMAVVLVYLWHRFKWGRSYEYFYATSAATSISVSDAVFALAYFRVEFICHMAICHMATTIKAL